jgi:hypothetical protein
MVNKIMKKMEIGKEFEQFSDSSHYRRYKVDYRRHKNISTCLGVVETLEEDSRITVELSVWLFLGKSEGFSCIKSSNLKSLENPLYPIYWWNKKEIESYDEMEYLLKTVGEEFWKSCETVSEMLEEVRYQIKHAPNELTDMLDSKTLLFLHLQADNKEEVMKYSKIYEEEIRKRIEEGDLIGELELSELAHIQEIYRLGYDKYMELINDELDVVLEWMKNSKEETFGHKSINWVNEYQNNYYK